VINATHYARNVISQPPIAMNALISQEAAMHLFKAINANAVWDMNSMLRHQVARLAAYIQVKQAVAIVLTFFT
jgi:hypothetical protein